MNYNKEISSYPVLYMHDGQYLVNESPYSNYSWEVLKTIDKMYNLINGIIIVGIDSDNKYRLMEYSNYLNNSAKKRLKRLNVNDIHPEADKYGKFIVEELKPMIDSEFRTKKNRENTYIAGSSCGGNISLYLGIKYQMYFSCIGAFSPALYIVKKGLYDYLNKTNINNRLYIYHDIGTNENGFFSKIYYDDDKEFHDYIINKIPKMDVLRIVDEGATHSEKHWAKRFEIFLLFCHKKT